MLDKKYFSKNLPQPYMLLTSLMSLSLNCSAVPSFLVSTDATYQQTAIREYVISADSIVKIYKQFWYLRFDGWLRIVLSERPPFVVHDAQRIVGDTVGQSRRMFLEVVFLSSLNVGPNNFNIVVSVLSALDMVCSKSMNEFMLNSAIWKNQR